MPVFLQEHFHLTQGVAGLSATGYANVAALPGILVGGAWADRWSRTNRRARMFVPAIGLLIAVPCVLLTRQYQRPGAGHTGDDPLPRLLRIHRCQHDAGLCEVVDPRYRATGYGIINMMNAFAGGLGIYAAGVLRDRKVDPSLTFDLVALFLYLRRPLLFHEAIEPAGDRVRRRNQCHGFEKGGIAFQDINGIF